MRKIRKICMLTIFLCLFIGFMSFYALAEIVIAPPQEEGICTLKGESPQECTNKPAELSTAVPQKNGKSTETKKPVHPSQKQKVKALFQTEIKEPPRKPFPVKLYFFWGKGCPHCGEEKQFLQEMKEKHPSLEIHDYEVWYDKENAALLVRMAEAYKLTTSGVPVTFIGTQGIVGFSQHNREELEHLIPFCISGSCVDPNAVLSGKILPETTGQHGQVNGTQSGVECTEKSRSVYIPWIGTLDASELSLPVMTLVIAGLDSFNPCAFFVLFSLLGILIYAQSRRKMLLTGGIFVFFSGFIYFVFMAAWLNLFLVMGQVALITTIAGAVAIIIALLNIKDFFVFKKGVSLTIPDSAKPKLFDRMRKLMKSSSFISVLMGTAVLAIAANSYELLCTAGFPMVFTRILTLNNLPNSMYYFYLALYNIIYVVPLSLIVLLFTITLGKKHLTEWQGRVLKLISGTMMLGLGGVLVVNPEILNSALVSFSLLVGALLISGVVILSTKKFFLQKAGKSRDLNGIKSD